MSQNDETIKATFAGGEVEFANLDDFLLVTANIGRYEVWLQVIRGVPRERLPKDNLYKLHRRLTNPENSAKARTLIEKLKTSSGKPFVDVIKGLM